MKAARVSAMASTSPRATRSQSHLSTPRAHPTSRTARNILHEKAHEIALPTINNNDTLPILLSNLHTYFSHLHLTCSDPDGSLIQCLKPLTRHLTSSTHNTLVPAALLVLYSHFSHLALAYLDGGDDEDDADMRYEDEIGDDDGEGGGGSGSGGGGGGGGGGSNRARARASEVVAGQFVSALAEWEGLEVLLAEVPDLVEVTREGTRRHDEERAVFRSADGDGDGDDSTDGRMAVDECAPLLRPKQSQSPIPAHAQLSLEDGQEEEDVFPALAASFAGLNALEIAAVVDAKGFLSRRAVQKVLHGLWKGDIVFWDSLSAGLEEGEERRKKARRWNQSKMDPYVRLRIPLYLKIYETIFFFAFLALYYAVLTNRQPNHITPQEIVLFMWLAAFTLDEFSQFHDAGLTFYTTDFWNGWDFGIIAIGFTFFILRIIGLAKHDTNLADTVYDILTLEALLLVPRAFSLLSLLPFFGVLIPCLRSMSLYALQFFILVAIIYAGFLTTFVLLAPHSSFSPATVSLMLLKIFFGSSYIGFDNAAAISPTWGMPLMIAFIWLTNVLLVTSLISLISERMSVVLADARGEYVRVFAVFVLEAAAGMEKRTAFYPPMNLIAVPFRLLKLGVEPRRLRAWKIVLLKITHAPVVAVMVGAEWLCAAFVARWMGRRRRLRARGLLGGPSVAGGMSRREWVKVALRSSGVAGKSKVGGVSGARLQRHPSDADEEEGPLLRRRAMVKRGYQPNGHDTLFSTQANKENQRTIDYRSDEDADLDVDPMSHSDSNLDEYVDGSEDNKAYDGNNDVATNDVDINNAVHNADKKDVEIHEKEQLITRLVAQVMQLTEKVEGLVEIVARQQEVMMARQSEEEDSRDEGEDM